MTKSLLDRITALEAKAHQDDISPGLIWMDWTQTLNEAKADYKRLHGYEFDEVNGTCVRISAYDAS